MSFYMAKAMLGCFDHAGFYLRKGRAATTEVLRGYVSFDMAGAVFCALPRMISQIVFLQERPAKVYWKSSRTGAPQKIVFREYLAKVPHKAALEKRPQHSQTSLESSRQAATRVSHQIESQKTIFQWSLAEMRHKRVTKASHKNCTRVPPRQKIQQECLPRVPFRSLPDSLPRVSWNVFHEAKASYSPACICHVSNQCKFSL
jgi:hypothetical protein